MTPQGLKDIETFINALDFNPYLELEKTFHSTGNNDQVYYFLSIMKNKLDTKAKRGAIVKALAIGSKTPQIIESYKSILNGVLDGVFEVEDLERSPQENLERVKSMLAMSFSGANAP